MPQQVSPFLEGKYGWSYGENGWNLGADENWLKFSYLHDGNVDSIVSSLPAASNGIAHFLTTDNRFYFAVGTTWYSSPCPKWFIFKIKSTGIFWQFDGSSVVEINNPTQANAALEALQDVVDTLGTAAFQPSESFATPAQLDIVSAQANDYTDALRADVFAKLNYVVDVKDFGAIGDYNPTTLTGTDNSVAFQDALDELVSRGGGTLYVPKGYYLVSSALTCSDIPLRVVGDSQDTSLIQCNTNAITLLTLTVTTPAGLFTNIHGGAASCLSIHDLSFCTSAYPTGAIYLNSAGDGQPGYPQLVLERVQIKSVNYTLAGFITGVRCKNVSGTYIDTFYYGGDAGNAGDGAGTFVCQAAIRMEGSASADLGNFTHYWNRLVIVSADKAIHVTEWQEGFYISNFEWVFCNYAYYHIGDVTYGATNTSLVNGHMNCFKSAIKCDRVRSLRLSNVDILRQFGNPQEGRLVDLFECHNFEWKGGLMYSFIVPTANEFGVILTDTNTFFITGISFNELEDGSILVDGGTGGVIAHNTFRADSNDSVQVYGSASDLTITGNKFLTYNAGTDQYSITLDASTSRVLVSDNMDDGTNDLLIANNSTSNRIGVNYGTGTGYRQFVDGDTTPQVDLTGASTFNTANTAATSIQGLDGGYVGMEVKVLCGDANTTLVHAGSGTVPLSLKNGVNAVLASGNVVQFVKTGTVWYEISRNF